jgi:uncharacterized coiled-coil DUF342 family protein
MKAMGRVTCYLLLAACVVGLLGCGKKAADETKPISEVKAEAEKMSVADLRAMAETYRDKIMAKKGELDTLVKKLADIPLAEKLGEEAKAIQADMGDLSKAIQALTERFKVYYDKLKEKGGDLSGLEI